MKTYLVYAFTGIIVIAINTASIQSQDRPTPQPQSITVDWIKQAYADSQLQLKQLTDYVVVLLSEIHKLQAELDQRDAQIKELRLKNDH